MQQENRSSEEELFIVMLTLESPSPVTVQVTIVVQFWLAKILTQPNYYTYLMTWVSCSILSSFKFCSHANAVAAMVLICLMLNSTLAENAAA